jgi:hypothetical protein
VYRRQETRRHIDKRQPIKHARQPPSVINYFAPRHCKDTKSSTWANNTLKYDVELNVCTSSISRHLNWKMTGKPLLTLHERCINTIVSSNIKPTKKSYKSKMNNEPITFSNTNKANFCFMIKKILILLSKSFHKSSNVET